MAGSTGLTSAELAHETLDSALDLGRVSSGARVLDQGSLGNGPAGAADVEWYSFTLDQPAQVNSVLSPREPGSSFRGVLSLFNNDPFDFMDPYNPDGHRLLEQVEGTADVGVATLDRLLGPGTYYLAVSGQGNLDFHPLLAGSGLPGITGAFDLQLSVVDAVLGTATGPRVLTSDPAALSSAPAANVSLTSSPLAFRFDLSGPLDPGTIVPGQTVRLIFSPSGQFDQDGQDISLTVNFSPAIEDAPPPDSRGAVLHDQGLNELQLFPASPLAPGHYEVILAGRSDNGSLALADPNGNDLGADADHSAGQDIAFPFQVVGIEGRAGTTADDTGATAQNLGDVTSAGLVQVAGAIGNDPFYNPANSADPFNPDPRYNPGNQVNMYRFHITGTGTDSLVAEVFAGRIGSPLDPGVSLFQVDSTGQLHFLAGNNNTYDPVMTTDGFSAPLYSDSVLYASLTPGDYCLAVAGGSNTPSPFEGLSPGSPGLFDPNVSHSGTAGSSTGPYVLNLLVQPASAPPHVVSTSPSEGATLTQPPTQLTVTFDQPVNVEQLAYQTFQVASQDTVSGVTIQDAGGTKYFPRFASYDGATHSATFVMLGALPNGDYQLHLSGAAGLASLGGIALAGNDPSGDYVVRFTVHAPPRGDEGNPLERSDQEPNDDLHHPQDLGVLFSNELAAGVTITRDFSQDPVQAPQDTADVYQFQVLLDRPYTITLSGDPLPGGVTMTLTDPSGQSAGLFSFDGTLLVGALAPGTYLLTVSGWDTNQAAKIAYHVALKLVSQNDNAPPLLSGPAPAIAIQLDSAAPPTPPTSPPPVAPPPIVTPPVTDPSPVGPPSSGTEPSPIAAPTRAEIVIAIPALSLSGPLSYGVTSTDVASLGTSSIGGVIAPAGARAATTLLVQTNTAIPQPSSTVVPGPLTVGTSLSLPPETEDGEATPSGPEVAEATMTNGEVSRVDVVAADLQEPVRWLVASVGDLWNQWAMSPPWPSLRENAPGAVSIPTVGVPGHEPTGSEVASADRASRGDAGLDRSDWGRAWVIILTCIGLGTEVSARCRGLGRRNPCRGQRRSPASLGPARGPSGSSLSSSIPRFPLTWLRSVLRPSSPVTPAKVPVCK